MHAWIGQILLRFCILGLSCVKFRKIEVYYIDTFHARRLRVNLGGKFTKITGLGAVLCLAISRNRGVNAPQPESPTRISRAKAALNGPVTDRRTDARPSRDGSEQFWSGTQAYAAKFEPAGVELGPNDERFRSPKTRFD